MIVEDLFYPVKLPSLMARLRLTNCIIVECVFQDFNKVLFVNFISVAVI